MSNKGGSIKLGILFLFVLLILALFTMAFFSTNSSSLNKKLSSITKSNPLQKVVAPMNPFNSIGLFTVASANNVDSNTYPGKSNFLGLFSLASKPSPKNPINIAGLFRLMFEETNCTGQPDPDVYCVSQGQECDFCSNGSCLSPIKTCSNPKMEWAGDPFCKCMCKTADYQACQAKGNKFVLDYKCDCVCAGFDPRTCNSNQNANMDTCKCECKDPNHDCGDPAKFTWDPDACKCVCKPHSSCPPLQQFNGNTKVCACECIGAPCPVGQGPRVMPSCSCGGGGWDPGWAEYCMVNGVWTYCSWWGCTAPPCDVNTPFYYKTCVDVNDSNKCVGFESLVPTPSTCSIDADCNTNCFGYDFRYDNAHRCPLDDVNVSVNTLWDLNQTCSSPVGSVPKCQAECDSGYDFNSYLVSCINRSNPPTCVGEPPSNASPCPGSVLNLVDYARRNLVASCSSPAVPCSYSCDDGYRFESGFCVPGSPYVCTGPIPDHSYLCLGDGVGLDHNTPNTLVASCTDGTKCEYVCEAGYHKEGSFCVQDTGACLGENIANASMCPNDARDVNGNYYKYLVASCSSPEGSYPWCQFTCDSGFTFVPGEVVLENSCQALCTGTDFNNAVLYAGDDTNLSQNTMKTLVDSNTSAKCEYHCAQGYSLSGGVCVPCSPKTCDLNYPGRCGLFDKGCNFGEVLSCYCPDWSTQDCNAGKYCVPKVNCVLPQISCGGKCIDPCPSGEYLNIFTCECIKSTHRVCSGGACITQVGAGIDECTSDFQCVGVGEKNSIKSFSASFDVNLMKLNFSYNCSFTNPVDGNITISDQDTGEILLTGKTCSSTVSSFEFPTTNVTIGKVLTLTLSIPQPCSVCQKTIYLPITPKQKQTSIPETDPIIIVLTLIVVVYIISRRKE